MTIPVRMPAKRQIKHIKIMLIIAQIWHKSVLLWCFIMFVHSHVGVSMCVCSSILACMYRCMYDVCQCIDSKIKELTSAVDNIAIFSVND